MTASLKPIETVYKGYKFRSRLEARWAVFFDEMGVEWEYEPQGFEFGNGLKYLPDFHLPKGDLFVEIKRFDAFVPTPAPPRLVYVAGKVNEREDSESWGAVRWRYDLDVYRRSEKDTIFLEWRADKRPVEFRNGYLYGGPHFADNHSCVTSHRRAFEQIERCDIFFAWIDGTDAHGTLVEIGFAQALNKDIRIGFASEELNKELWFARQCARFHAVYQDPNQAFDSLLGHVEYLPKTDEERKIAAMSLFKNVMVCFGDPMEKKSAFYGSGMFENWCVGFEGQGNFKTAALAARQARFEHGARW